MSLSNQEALFIRLYHDPGFRNRFLGLLRGGKPRRALQLARSEISSLSLADLEPFRTVDPRRMRRWTLYEMRMFLLRERVNPAFAGTLLCLAAAGSGSLDDVVESYFSDPVSRRFDLEPLERFALFARPALARRGIPRAFGRVLAYELQRSWRSGVWRQGRPKTKWVLRLLAPAEPSSPPLLDYARGLGAFQELLFAFDSWEDRPRLGVLARKRLLRAARAAA